MSWRVLNLSLTAVLVGVFLLVGLSDDGTDRNGFDKAWSSLKSGFATVSAYGLALATNQKMTRVLPDDPLPGFLYIEAPQLYTRERLVNDRFRQANWLSKELKRTTDEDDASRFGAASLIEQKSQLTRVMAQLGVGNGGVEAANPSKHEDGQVRPVLDQLRLLERRISYRAELRNELMDTQLDDGHDLDGNTLYRLNFDAVALPWADSRTNPGAAIFIVTAKQSNGLNDAQVESSDADVKQFLEDDLQLLRAWQREMQLFLTSILRFRTEEFERNGTLPNRTDPKEDIAFDWFLRVTLIENFLDLLVDRVRLEFDCGSNCDAATQEFERVWNQSNPDKRRALRRDFFATWAGFSYRSLERVPEINVPVWQASFRSAIRRARDVNDRRWRAGQGLDAYDRECLKGWREQSDRNEETDGKQKSKDETKPTLPEFCARSMPDPNNLRAIVRLITVVEAMRDFYGPVNEEVFRMSFDRFGAQGGPSGLMDLLVRFAEIIPSLSEVEAQGKIWQAIEGKARLKNSAEDLCFDVAPDIFEFGRCSFLNASAGRAAEKMIARFIEARLNGTLPAYGAVERPVSEFLDVRLAGCIYTRCRFEIRRKAPYTQADIEDMLDDESERPANAMKVHRLSDDVLSAVADQSRCATDVIGYQNLYRKGAPDRFQEKYIRRLDLPDAILAAEKEREIRADFTELYAACRLRVWLDSRRNDLVVYGVSPRLRGEVSRKDADRSLELSAAGAAAKGPEVRVDRQQSLQRSEASITPLVIGFSQLAPKGNNLASPSRETVFGWAVRSTQSSDGTWKAGHHRLSAVLSVPSWWKRLEFKVLACWSLSARAREIGQEILKNPSAICPEPEESKDVKGEKSHTVQAAMYGSQGRDDIEGSSSGKDKRKGVNTLVRNFRIQLPRRSEDVTARFNFDFIKTPYFEPDWNDRIVRTPIALEIGRKGRVVLPGERLWRGTVVTLGEQPADKIIVLPNMKGVIAEFDCVVAPPGLHYTKTFASLPNAAKGERDGFEKMPKQVDEEKVAASEKTAETTTKSAPESTAKSTAGSTGVKEREAGKNRRNAAPEKSAPDPRLLPTLTVWTAEGRTPTGTRAKLEPFVQRTVDEKPCFAQN